MFVVFGMNDIRQPVDRADVKARESFCLLRSSLPVSSVVVLGDMSLI